MILWEGLRKMPIPIPITIDGCNSVVDSVGNAEETITCVQDNALGEVIPLFRSSPEGSPQVSLDGTQSTVESIDLSTSILSMKFHREYLNAIREIEGYSNLEFGWDGHYGEEISTDTIDFSIKMVNFIFGKISLAGISSVEFESEPISDGRIGFEIIIAGRILNLMFESSNPNKITCYREDESGSVVEDGLEILFVSDLEEKLSWVSS